MPIVPITLVPTMCQFATRSNQLGCAKFLNKVEGLVKGRRKIL